MTGLLIGSIQRVIQSAQEPKHVKGIDTAKKFADDFVKENHLPQYTDVTLDPNGSGNITLVWSSKDARQLQHVIQNITGEPVEIPINYKIIFSPNSTPQGLAIVRTYNGFEGMTSLSRFSLQDLSITGKYPAVAQNNIQIPHPAISCTPSLLDEHMSKTQIDQN